MEGPSVASGPSSRTDWTNDYFGYMGEGAPDGLPLAPEESLAQGLPLAPPTTEPTVVAELGRHGNQPLFPQSQWLWLGEANDEDEGCPVRAGRDRKVTGDGRRFLQEVRLWATHALYLHARYWGGWSIK